MGRITFHFLNKQEVAVFVNSAHRCVQLLHVFQTLRQKVRDNNELSFEVQSVIQGQLGCICPSLQIATGFFSSQEQTSEFRLPLPVLFDNNVQTQLKSYKLKESRTLTTQHKFEKLVWDYLFDYEEHKQCLGAGYYFWRKDYQFFFTNQLKVRIDPPSLTMQDLLEAPVAFGKAGPNYVIAKPISERRHQFASYVDLFQHFNRHLTNELSIKLHRPFDMEAAQPFCKQRLLLLTYGEAVWNCAFDIKQDVVEEILCVHGVPTWRFSTAAFLECVSNVKAHQSELGTFAMPDYAFFVHQLLSNITKVLQTQKKYVKERGKTK